MYDYNFRVSLSVIWKKIGQKWTFKKSFSLKLSKQKQEMGDPKKLSFGTVSPEMMFFFSLTTSGPFEKNCFGNQTFFLESTF